MNSRLKFLVIATSTCLAILLVVGSVLGKSSSDDGAYRQLAVFTEVVSRIKSDYVEEPDMKNVTLGALNGLLEAIDPFASYLSADQYKQYLKARESDKADVGLVLSKRFGYVGVVGVIPGSPAAKAGMSTGDVIEAIRGIATRDMPLAYAELLLRGEAGSTVELSILRVRRPDPQKLLLTRALIQAPPVTAKMLPDDVGYVKPETLLAGKAKEVASALARLEKQGAKRFVLDLRGCSVGDPAEGIALANLFLDKGLITYLQGQRVARQNYDASPSAVVSRLPLVVTTNRGTADGAEIAAAALGDNKRAEIVGERSYGDAAMRRAITLDDGSAVLLSVAKYYSPGGKALQDGGVTPTVVVAEAEPLANPDDEEAPAVPVAPEPPQQPGEDNVLKKAIEVLTRGVTQEARTQAQAAAAGQSAMTPLGVPRPPR